MAKSQKGAIMASVQLDRGNFVLLGKNVNGEYMESFCEIMDMVEDEATVGLHWLKLKVKVDTIHMNLQDELELINSNELSSVPKLEVYGAEEGAEILVSLQDRIESRRMADEARQRMQEVMLPEVTETPVATTAPTRATPTHATPVETLAQEFIAERILSEEEDIEDISEEDAARQRRREALTVRRRRQTTEEGLNAGFTTMPVRAERPSRAELREAADPYDNTEAPTPEPAPEPEPTITPTLLAPEVNDFQLSAKGFNTNLYSGDMKTILKIAEESPDKVYAVVSKAVLENGHTIMDELSSDMREQFINLRINELEKFMDIEIRKNSVYEFNHHGILSRGMFLGLDSWIFMEDEENHNGFVMFDPVLYKENIITEITGNGVTDVALKVGRMLPNIEPGFKERLDESPDTKIITVKVGDIPERFNAEDFGKEWENAIVYAYFLETQINWDKIDMASFKEVDAIRLLAEARDDNRVLEGFERVA